MATNKFMKIIRIKNMYASKNTGPKIVLSAENSSKEN
jgi:hypothetical protein